MEGPDLASGLVGVLTRFRKDKLAVVADVKAIIKRISTVPEFTNVLY